MILACSEKWHKARSMDKATRADLLRKRFTALGGKLPPICSTKKRKLKGPAKAYRTHYSYGVSLCETRCRWVETPDGFPTTLCEPKRRLGKRALVEIANKQPQKPKRRYATAEGWLSERKQQ